MHFDARIYVDDSLRIDSYIRMKCDLSAIHIVNVMILYATAGICCITHTQPARLDEFTTIHVLCVCGASALSMLMRV